MPQRRLRLPRSGVSGSFSNPLLSRGMTAVLSHRLPFSLRHAETYFCRIFLSLLHLRSVVSSRIPTL